MGIIISLTLPVTIVVFILFTIINNKRLTESYKNSVYKPGWNGIINGEYISHWEIGRFVWVNDIVKREKSGNPGNCCMITNLNDMGNIPSGNISFIGEIEGIGSFGHRGMNMFKIRFISWNNAA